MTDETEASKQETTTREIIAAEDKINNILFGSATRRRRTWSSFLFVVLAVVSARAAQWVGFDVGWLIGASSSPIAQAIAPAIFGLVAAIGISSRFWKKLAKPQKRPVIIVGWRAKRHEIWRTILTALLVLLFCQEIYNGILRGIASRTLPYADVPDLLPEFWPTINDEMATDLLAFRVRAKSAGVPHDAYDLFMVDVVGGILRDGYLDKLYRIRHEMARFEASFPKPAPKTDNNSEPKQPAEPGHGE